MSDEVTYEEFLENFQSLKDALEERKTELLQRYQQMENNPGQLGEDLTDLELVDLEFDIKELEDKIAAVESKRTEHSGDSELTVSSLSLAEESAVKEGSGSGSGSMLEFLARNIQEKEAELECPVCLSEASSPLYSCDYQHLVCSSCLPLLQARDNLCPSCRSSYRNPVTRHRYAERIAGELAQLWEQFGRLSN